MRAEIEARGFDLKAVNPNVVDDEDRRTPSQLLDVIEAKQGEIATLIAELRSSS
jgi:type I restriction enzyme M protein